MPTDLLLPAFVLTLLANAALVAVAIRGLNRARAERDRPGPPDRQRRVAHVAPDLAQTAAEPIVAAAATPSNLPAPEPAAVVEVPAPPESGPAKPPRRTRAVPPKPAAPKPAAQKAAASKPASPKQPPKRTRAADIDRPRSEARRGGRRRFSLPPLDDDHERVNRSIETFLSGGDGVEGADTGAGSPTGATTVAIVAIDGLHPDAATADRQAVDGVMATVERTLRGAARAADRVSGDGKGRFRVVLPATGEVAARAYLRRVRATVGPSLDAVDVPLGLVTATATVLDDTVHVAVAQAEARLDAALASAPRQASDDEPRAAH